MFILNHTSLDMDTSQIDPKYLKFVLTNTVQYVWIDNCQIDFKDLITSLPPYIAFSYTGNVPNDWERLLLKHAPILDSIVLNPQRITNYKYLKMLLSKKILYLVSIETENFPVIKSRWNSHFRPKKPKEKPFIIIPKKNKTESYVIK
uniref:Uncharacterized protein n=1 Tax=Panagrolaimus sp. JU765 TaxID=591449 RepID=A0AC34RJP4_9BILA